MAEVEAPPAVADDNASPPIGNREHPQAAQLAQALQVGRGFVAWNAIDHPDHEGAEVGGFVQAPISHLLAEEEREALFETHHAFLIEVCGFLPRCEIESAGR